MIKLAPIHPDQLEALTSCFNAAFANYFVPFNVNADYLRMRWKIARVRYDLSYAAFVDDQPVAFIIHGIDEWNGLLTAFNTGTGVIPEYRGQRLVDRLYEKMIPELKSAGVRQCRLEVITENERAIKVYSRIGFSIERTMDCFKGEMAIQNQLVPGLQFKKVDRANWTAYQQCQDISPSWDHVKAGIEQQAKFEFWEAYLNHQWVGYIIIEPEVGHIAQFGIHPDFRRQGLGRTLFEEIRKRNPIIKLNNIDQKGIATLAFLNNLGIPSHISQHEMSMMI